jgi:hypothetical protein
MFETIGWLFLVFLLVQLPQLFFWVSIVLLGLVALVFVLNFWEDYANSSLKIIKKFFPKIRSK